MSPVLAQGRGRIRILLAVLASAAVHLWVAENTPTGVIRSTVPFPVPRLEARLQPGEPLADRGEPAPAVVHPEGAGPTPETTHTQRAAVRATSPGAQQAKLPTAAEQEATAPAALRASPRATDSVYYSARELDVYPAPLAPLQFRYPAHLSGEHAGGEVLVRLLLDEAGAVDEATVIAAQRTGPFDEYARAMLAAARFSPGRREGRAVKSQLTVRVSVESAAHGEALR